MNCYISFIAQSRASINPNNGNDCDQLKERLLSVQKELEEINSALGKLNQDRVNTMEDVKKTGKIIEEINKQIEDIRNAQAIEVLI